MRHRIPLIAVLICAIGLCLPAYCLSATQTDRRGVRRQRSETVAQWPARPKRWALIIGIDDYKDKRISSLRSAAKDARLLADTLIQRGGFPSDQVIVLATDQLEERQPTRGNILRRLSNLAAVVPKDGLLLLSFAGHGMERNQQAFLLPSDAQISDDVSFLEETALSVTRIKDRIKATGVQQVVMLLDACRNDPAAGRANAPNRLSEAYTRGFNFDVRNKEVTAFATLFATAVGERAYEYSEKQQGYFTWAIVEGLKGGAANEKGEVTLSGLVSFLQVAVPKRIQLDLGAGKHQRPFVQTDGYKADELVIAVGATLSSGGSGTSTTHAVGATQIELSDVTAPQITILEPAVQRGLRIVRKDKAITVRGRVTDENGIYEVSVNDAEASVAANGDFQAQVLLAVGENQIRVRATDAKKNTSETAFAITRESDSMKGVIQPADHEPAFIRGRFYALIIAVQNYHDPSVNGLDHPIQDASRLKAILTGNYSFEEGNIIFLRDPDRATIINKLDELTEKITENDCLLIFYAGHGYWDETLRQGFWLPSNAKRDTRSEWLPNSTLRDYLGGIKAKHTLLIADACFSGSIFKTRDAFSDAQASVKELYRLPSRKAMTSGAMKSVPDKSVFVEYLVKRLAENQQRYISAEELFSSMRKAIINNSPNKQTPQYGEIRETGDEGGDFVFVRR